MPAIRLSVAARTDAGRVRKNNEDAFTVAELDTGEQVESQMPAVELGVRERGVLLIVSDGMGGHAAGEVASAMVVDSVRETLKASDNSAPVEELLERAVQQANAEVFEAARDSSKEGMGATLTAVLVHGAVAYIAEVGDSRAYVLRQGRLRQVTRDQSYVQMLLDTGTITAEQAQSFAHKNWIVQAMGLEPVVQVSLAKLALCNGDRLMVCCDGLYGLVKDEELAAILAEDDASIACNRMVDLANERGGTDNVTAIVAKVEGDGVAEPDCEESVTQTFEVLKEYTQQDARSPTPTSPPPRPTPPPVAPPAEPPPAMEAVDDPLSEVALSRSTPPVEPVSPEQTSTAPSAIGRLSIVVMGIVLVFTAAGYWFVLAN